MPQSNRHRISKKHQEVKKKVWGAEFLSKRFYVNTVGKNDDKNTIQNYVKYQGKEKEYKKIRRQQLSIFVTAKELRSLSY